jgi:hypothetical protein
VSSVQIDAGLLIRRGGYWRGADGSGRTDARDDSSDSGRVELHDVRSFWSSVTAGVFVP